MSCLINSLHYIWSPVLFSVFSQELPLALWWTRPAPTVHSVTGFTDLFGHLGEVERRTPTHPRAQRRPLTPTNSLEEPKSSKTPATSPRNSPRPQQRNPLWLLCPHIFVCVFKTVTFLVFLPQTVSWDPLGSHWTVHTQAECLRSVNTEFRGLESQMISKNFIFFFFIMFVIFNNSKLFHTPKELKCSTCPETESEIKLG